MCGSLLLVLPVPPVPPRAEPLDDDPAVLLRREVLALAEGLRRLPPQGWTAAAAGTGRSRADVAWHTASVLASLSRSVEGLEALPLPRPTVDVALADAVAVCGADLVVACVAGAGAATATGTGTGTAGRPGVAAHALLEVLGHRAQLLADAVPPRLVAVATASLGWPEVTVEQALRRACPGGAGLGPPGDA